MAAESHSTNHASRLWLPSQHGSVAFEIVGWGLENQSCHLCGLAVSVGLEVEQFGIEPAFAQ